MSNIANLSWEGAAASSPSGNSANFSWQVVVLSDTFSISDTTNFSWNPYDAPDFPVAVHRISWETLHVATANLEFLGPDASPPADGVNLDFSPTVIGGDPVYLDSFSETGEEFTVGSLFVASNLGAVDMATGESLGGLTYDLKDIRNYPAIGASALPYSLGLTFLANSQPSWPSGYTLTSPYRHLYSNSFGVNLEISSPTPLVLPAIAASVEIFGPGNGFYSVYSKDPAYIDLGGGEELSTTLSLEFLGMGNTVYHGEAMSWFLSTVRILAPNEMGMGAALAFDLEIQSTRIEMATGENVTLTLDVYDLVGGANYTGETLTTSLATSATLDVSASTGEAFDTVPEFHPAAFLAIALSSGQSLTPLLGSGGVAIVKEWGTGEMFAPMLTVPSRADFVFQMWDGSNFTPLYIQTSIALGSFVGTEGATLTVLSLDEVSNYKAANGETLTSTLEVTQSMSVGAAGGERLSTSLTPAPGGELSVRLYDGSNFVQSSMDVLEAIYLHCNLFTGVWVEATESTATTSFDLEGPPMYHNTLDWWLEANQFEFVDMPPSFVYGHGAGVVVRADLSIRPRFSISMATGESFETQSNSRYLDAEISVGTMDLPAEYLYVEPHINLCYPNVFPSADNMEVELDFAEDSCYTDVLGVGERLNLSVSATFGLKAPDMATGESLSFVLTIYDLWRVRFYVGEALTATLGTTAAMTIPCRTGEAVRMTFEEPSVLFYTGSSLEATLQTTFDVEFSEVGCLDNEYVYITETGDVDADKFSPAAVELAPFSHDIKARCF